MLSKIASLSRLVFPNIVGAAAENFPGGPLGGKSTGGLGLGIPEVTDVGGVLIVAAWVCLCGTPELDVELD